MWLALFGILKPIWAFLKTVPWWVYAAGISAIFLWWLYSNRINAAELRGETKVHTEWDAANLKAATDAAKERAALDLRLRASTATIISDTNERIAKAQADAKTATEKLRALKRAKPLPPSCVLNSERIVWANSLITGTEATATPGDL